MSRAAKRSIYLDNAASTPIDKGVIKAMSEASLLYGNPSSFNDAGRAARKEIDKARSGIAKFIGARPEEVIFTSSGSEANSLAIFGLAGAREKGEIISTPIEHPSVLELLKKLSEWGWKITYLKVDKNGLIDLDDLDKKLNPGVALVSIIYVNNEIGTIQPIKKISKIIKQFKTPLLHIDACQAAGYLDMNVNNLGADMMTFNGSKIYGPRGSGILYVKKGISISPFILGGGQEHGLRAGTEDLPAIIGMAKAISLMSRDKNNKAAELRDYFFNEIKRLMPDVRINGPYSTKVSKGRPEREGRVANNINISIPDLDSESLLLELDKYGIYASSGSACTSRSVEPSHVLKAIGVESKYINGALRFSLGKQTTKKDIDYVLNVLPKVVTQLKDRYKK